MNTPSISQICIDKQANRDPATQDQLSELAKSLSRLDEECQLMFDLVQTIYGYQDGRSSRAEEVCNTLQRLKWALNRDVVNQGVPNISRNGVEEKE